MYYITSMQGAKQVMEVNSGGDGTLVGGIAEVSQVISKIISSGEEGQSKAKETELVLPRANAEAMQEKG